jgi:hypothetical protein
LRRNVAPTSAGVGAALFLQIACGALKGSIILHRVRSVCNGCWQRDLGLDHLLCSREAADRLRGARVDKWAEGEENASNHAPTSVELVRR